MHTHRSDAVVFVRKTLRQGIRCHRCHQAASLTRIHLCQYPSPRVAEVHIDPARRQILKPGQQLCRQPRVVQCIANQHQVALPKGQLLPRHSVVSETRLLELSVWGGLQWQRNFKLRTSLPIRFRESLLSCEGASWFKRAFSSDAMHAISQMSLAITESAPAWSAIMAPRPHPAQRSRTVPRPRTRLGCRNKCRATPQPPGHTNPHHGRPHPSGRPRASVRYLTPTRIFASQSRPASFGYDSRIRAKGKR